MKKPLYEQQKNLDARLAEHCKKLRRDFLAKNYFTERQIEIVLGVFRAGYYAGVVNERLNIEHAKIPDQKASA